MKEYLIDYKHIPDSAWADALNVQDACNASGVIHSLADLMKPLWEEAHDNGKGTDWVNHHPLVVLFAYKIADLAHAGVQSYFPSDAYSFCQRMASEGASIAV